MLPTIREETFNRVCPKEVFCDSEIAWKFVCDNMVLLEDINSKLYTFLMDILIGEKAKSFQSPKTVGFDAVLASVAICKLIAEESTLPVVSDEVYNEIITEFSADPIAFCNSIDNRLVEVTIDKYIITVMVVCSGNYQMFGYHQEMLYIKATAFMIYKMLEKQAILDERT